MYLQPQPDWEKFMGYAQTAVASGLGARGICLRNAGNLFSQSVWQSLWLSPTKKAIALKMYPEGADAVCDPLGILPTMEETVKHAGVESFCLYRWPSLEKVGWVPIDVWRAACPDAIPLVDIPMATRAWYRQKYGQQQK